MVATIYSIIIYKLNTIYIYIIRIIMSILIKCPKIVFNNYA